MAGSGKPPTLEWSGPRFLTASPWPRSARWPWLPPILKPSMPEPASPTFARIFLPATASLNPPTPAPHGVTSVWRTRARSAALPSIRGIRTSFTSPRWGTLTVPAPMVPPNSAASINPSMEERIGRALSISDRKSAFQISQSVPALRSSCLPARGKRAVLPGVRTLPSMDPAVAFTVLKMPATPGPASAETACPVAIGDGLASMSRPTASGFTRSLRQEDQRQENQNRNNPASIARTMAATPGCSPMLTLVLPVERGISIASPSIRRIPT